MSLTGATVAIFLTGYVPRATTVSCMWSDISSCSLNNTARSDAAELVRTIMKAVKYLHDSGIVHRNLKPENMLFRTPGGCVDVMISNFALCRDMTKEKIPLLTDICGTPGYMAPEILKKSMCSAAHLSYND